MSRNHDDRSDGYRSRDHQDRRYGGYGGYDRDGDYGQYGPYGTSRERGLSGSRHRWRGTDDGWSGRDRQDWNPSDDWTARNAASTVNTDDGPYYGDSYGLGYGASDRMGGYGDQFGGLRYGRTTGARTQLESHAGRGPRGYRRSDERIREDVLESLTEHGEVDASDVDVRVADGEVYLSGEVPDRAQKRRAEDIAERVRGVRDVHNRLRAPGPVRRVADTFGLIDRDRR